MVVQVDLPASEPPAEPPVAAPPAPAAPPASAAAPPAPVPLPLDTEAKLRRLRRPEPYILRTTVILTIGFAGLYALGAFGLGKHADDYRPLFAWMPSETYLNFTKKMDVTVAQAIRRILWIGYASLFVSMWWVYFRSKLAAGPEPEKGGLPIRSLRRSLGLMAAQWRANSDENTVSTTEAYQRKSESSMVVFSMLIAGSILLFEQLAGLWASKDPRTTWEIIVIWLGMFASTSSFICLMLCVDALDTVFNVFPHDTKHKTIRYFYRYTIDPRYAAVASMLGSMILLLALYDETLSSMLIGVTYWVGYSFWFPDFSSSPQKVSRKSGLTLVLLPVVVLLATAIL